MYECICDIFATETLTAVKNDYKYRKAQLLAPVNPKSVLITFYLSYFSSAIFYPDSTLSGIYNPVNNIMKPTSILFAAPALLTHVLAGPVPVSSSLDVTDSSLMARGPQTGTECGEFHDGHGKVPCTHFSVVFGNGSPMGGKGTITIQGINFRKRTELSCANPNEFEGFETELPFVVLIKGGNACKLKGQSDAFDNTVSLSLLLPIYVLNGQFGKTDIIK